MLQLHLSRRIVSFWPGSLVKSASTMCSAGPVALPCRSWHPLHHAALQTPAPFQLHVRCVDGGCGGGFTSKSRFSCSHQQRRCRHSACIFAHNSTAGSCDGKPITHNVVQLLRERGLVADVTSPQLEELVDHTSVKIYCGFDPTADSLHLGNLLGIIVLAWFQRWACNPVKQPDSVMGIRF